MHHEDHLRAIGRAIVNFVHENPTVVSRPLILPMQMTTSEWEDSDQENPDNDSLVQDDGDKENAYGGRSNGWTSIMLVILLALIPIL